MSEAEFEELTMLYAAKGLTPQFAGVLAKKLTDCDAFAAHVDVDLRRRSGRGNGGMKGSSPYSHGHAGTMVRRFRHR
jgi:hypothetical protein